MSTLASEIVGRKITVSKKHISTEPGEVAKNGNYGGDRSCPFPLTDRERDPSTTAINMPKDGEHG